MKSALPVWPYYEENQINSAKEVLKSGQVNYWTGNKCKTLQNMLEANIQYL